MPKSSKSEKTYDSLTYFFSLLLKPYFQILWIAIMSLVILFGIIYKPYKTFESQESEAPINPVTPQILKEWGGVPTQVNVGLHIINFPVFDLVNNEFIFDAILWFEFDPALISLNTVAKFVFEKSDILQQSEPYTRVIENKFFARYNIRVRLKQNLEFKDFPFDDHRLDIALSNRTIQPSEMNFISYSSFFSLSPAVSFPGFAVSNTTVKTGWTESILEKFEKQKSVTYPTALFSIFLLRKGIRNILLILLPLFMIYFVSLFTLSFDPKKHGRVIFGLSSAGVTALLAYRFVIENITPRVGYFVLSDRIFILLLGATLIIFVLGLVALYLDKNTKALIIIRGISYIVMNAAILIFTYIFFNF